MSTEELQLFGLSLFAGMSTLIGYLIVIYFGRKQSPAFLSLSMGFTAGVMLYLSFVELLGEAFEGIEAEYGHETGAWYVVIAFFIGLGITALIDKLVPSYENPHEFESGLTEAKNGKSGLYRVGILATLAIAIHNFPEGIATVFGGAHDVGLGVTIAIAIAIHNIPEGIAVSAPIFKATGSRKKAFYYTFVAGIAEPIGAIVGYYTLKDFIDASTFSLMLAVIAGIMVFISFDQILPATEKYGRHHLTTYSIITGMGVMALTILMLH